MREIKVHHVIKPTKKQFVPLYNIFVDTEAKITDGKIENNGETKEVKYQTFRLGSACFLNYKTKQEEWIEFYKTVDFWNFFFSKLEEYPYLWLWAHNMDYDAQILQMGKYIMCNERFDVENFFGEGLRFILLAQYRADRKINNKNLRRVVCVSSTNYLPVSLQTLAKAVGMSKLEGEGGKAAWELEDDSKVMAYCKQDVNILKTFISKFFDFWTLHKYGTFGYTSASCSMRAFTTQYLSTNIFVHRDEEVLSLEEKAYKGGRTECFKIGTYEPEGGVYVFDVNSMYPAIMKSFSFPKSLQRFYENVSPEQLLSMLDNKLVIAEVKVKVAVPVVGVRIGERLCFPIGTFSGVFTSPELNLIREFGEILECKRVAVYSHFHLFDTFVEELFELRKKYKNENNGAMELLCKLILNSLYGKFAQKTPHWRMVGTCSREEISSYSVWDCEEERYYHYRSFGGKTYMQDGYSYGFYSFPAIASFVSAYGRCYLFRLLYLTGYDDERGFYNAYYCDTDSIFVNKEGAKRLIDNGHVGEQLGALKLEKVAKKISVNGLKDYVLYEEGKITEKLKGIRKTAERVSSSEGTVFLQDNFVHFSTNVKKYRFDGVVVERIEKRLNRKYNKGEVINGIVVPYVLRE